MPENRDRALNSIPAATGAVRPLDRPSGFLSPDAIVVGNLDGRIVAVDPTLCRLTGYDEAELLGMQFVALLAPEWSDFVLRRLQRKVDALEEETRYECVLLDRSGTRIPVEICSTLVRVRDEISGVRGAIRDTRERLVPESRLRESEACFRGAFESAPIGMAIVATDGHWLKVNDALCELLGYSRDELLDLTFQELTHPSDLHADLEAMQRMLGGESATFHAEKRYVRGDGRVIWGLLAVALLRGADGSPAYFISQVQDITAQRKTESAAARIRAAHDGVAPSLSRRETEVLGLLADGHLTAEAAAALGVGEETVQTLVRRAMRKLGARNRTQAVAVALRLGLLDAADAAPFALDG